jgi:hypothetical protein
MDRKRANAIRTSSPFKWKTINSETEHSLKSPKTPPRNSVAQTDALTLGSFKPASKKPPVPCQSNNTLAPARTNRRHTRITQLRAPWRGAPPAPSRQAGASAAPQRTVSIIKTANTVRHSTAPRPPASVSARPFASATGQRQNLAGSGVFHHLRKSPLCQGHLSRGVASLARESEAGQQKWAFNRGVAVKTGNNQIQNGRHTLASIRQRAPTQVSTTDSNSPG